MRWTLPTDPTARLVLLTQLLCVGGLAILALPPLARVLPPVVSSGMLAVCIATFLASAVRVALRTEGARRAIFVGLAGTIFFSLVAQAYLTVLMALGRPHVGITPALWIFLLGAHPCLIGGFVTALGMTHRGMRFEVLVDAMLLMAAAVIITLLLPPLSADPDAPLLVRVLTVYWQAAITAELLLVALVIAWRGELMGGRTAIGLTLGTVSFAVANALHSRTALPAEPVLVTATDPLWMLTITCAAIALDLRAGRPAPAPTARDVAWMRTGSIVVAILLSAGSALALGLHGVRRLDLAIAVAGFGVLLAIRTAHALVVQRRETRVLQSSVVAERELSATLEHRVAERTGELAEAQRVLQRMWMLGQQITLELSPARVLQRFMEAVIDIAQVDGGTLGLLTEEGKLRISAASGRWGWLKGRIVPLSGTAMGRVVRTGRSWTEADVSAHPDRIYAPALAQADEPLMRGVVVVPLLRRGEIIGAVALASEQPREFSGAEVARIEAMTDMLSVALANAELVETLRQAEWRFRTLFRAAPDAVFTVLQSGRVREANDVVRDITGFDPVQVIGRPFLDLVCPEDRPQLSEAMTAAFVGGARRLEVRFERAETLRTVALALSRLPEADPPTLLLIGRDITGEREMRTRLMETERLAAVGELVAGVAHEVNNPLSSISAFAQLLLRDGGLTVAQRDSIEVIKAETLRASQVVKDLLAFARRSEPQREPFDLNGVVERTLRLRGYQLTAHRVRVEQSLAPGLPAVIGDARQVQQVLLNLVTNAIQAMAPLGGGMLHVRTRHAGTSVVLEISDTGPGIPPHTRVRIFEPFFTTKREGEGTGLGLSVSYGIVTAHGGMIEVVDTSPQGTTFAVTLPAAEHDVARAGSSDAAPAAARSPLAGLRLLFVDDEPTLRSGIEAFGRLRGFGVVTAADGREALEAVRTTTFDAVVCDLRMPGMDGFAFLDALRKERPGLAARTIFITGDLVSTAARLTPTSHRQVTLTKPFTFERLEEALVAVTRGNPAQMAGVL